MSTDFVMDENLYLGAVKLNSLWRFFYDEREMWILDYQKYVAQQFNTMSRRRNGLEVIDDSTADQYCKAMRLELSSVEISSLVDKPQLSYVINFDQKVYVDAGRKDGFDLNIQYVPIGWQAIEDDPYFYVPTSVREHWVNKHVLVEGNAKKIGVYDYNYIGVVKLNREWRFYYEMFAGWIMDFDSFIRRFRPDYFTNPIYGDWRKIELTKVDVQSAQKYCDELQKHELLLSEIPLLTFNKLDSHRQGKEPKLRFVINFDQKLFVDGAFTKVALNIEPSKKYAPVGWTCHADNPYHYIPPPLRVLWGKA